MFQKKIAIIISFRDFRDEEYFVPKEVLEAAGAEIRTASNSKSAKLVDEGEKEGLPSLTKIGRAIGADGGDAEVDLLVSEINAADFDALVFIGGPGALKYLDNENSYKIIREAMSQGKIIGAICIAPLILAKSGVLKRKRATVWSSPTEKGPVRILEDKGVIYEDKPVVVDGKIITANGPAAAREFGETIVKLLTEK